MTKDKAEKAAVRARMAKTGERYTTARHYLLDHHHIPDSETAEQRPDDPGVRTEAAPEADLPALPEWAANPGMSDGSIQRGTGKTWDEWFVVLDGWGGATQSHTEIARYIYDEFGLEGWWAQGVAVGYERARGLRVRNQSATGFTVSASKTFAAPVEAVFSAFIDEAQRDTWLEPGTLRFRTARPHRTARFDVLLPNEAGTRLEIYFTAKSESKASAALQHTKLPDADAIEPWRAFWKERLERLAEVLKER